MKNLSLTVKIWLAISALTLVLYLIVLLFMPHLIHNYFTDALMVRPPNNEPPPGYFITRDFNIRGFTILADGATVPQEAGKAFSAGLLQQIKENAAAQQVPRQLHESSDGQTHIRYVIHKETVAGQTRYLVMFLGKADEDRFISRLLFNVALYASIALLMSWFASLFIARYLTKPLVQMQHHVKRIASRDWHDPLEINQGDEIGQLAHSIEAMRRQLIQQDEAQQTMLQNISHELKTPVMVIRSYAQAINDSIFPRGDLAGSIKVIDEEGERLEKLIKQLLYLNRLDYLATHKTAPQTVSLEQLITGIAQRMNLHRPEIQLQLELQPVTIAGDKDTLRVMIENLLDNHLRHAAARLEIKLSGNEALNECSLYFWNDGSPIDPQLFQDLAQPFQKGQGGKFGLGLTIVHRIVTMYRGQLSLENERDGVASKVVLPL